MSHRKAPLILIPTVCFLLGLAVSTLTAESPAPAATTGPAKGTLVIVGGQAQSASIFERFIKLAGGSSSLILIVPTAKEDAEAILDNDATTSLRDAGATNLKLLHTRDRKVADSDEFIAPIGEAGGIWFTGGRQWRLADAYLGTKTLRAFFEVLERGGVIGGSSAGATIQGSLLVRGDPAGNAIVLSPGHLEGFAFLKKSAIDQHVLVRHREKDLIPVIQQHPKVLGIGLDEDTAIIVKGDQFEVLGTSKALIYDATASHPEGAPWWLELSDGDRFDLSSRKKLEPAR